MNDSDIENSDIIGDELFSCLPPDQNWERHRCYHQEKKKQRMKTALKKSWGIQDPVAKDSMDIAISLQPIDIYEEPALNS